MVATALSISKAAKRLILHADENLLDLFHVSIWQTAYRGHLKWRIPSKEVGGVCHIQSRPVRLLPLLLVQK